MINLCKCGCGKECKKNFVLGHHTRINHPISGKHLSEETKLKISKARKGLCVGKDNPMYKKGFVGENNPMYGHKYSEETLKKISEAQKGRKHKEKLKERWRRERKGKNNSMFGKKFSEESKEKMRKNNWIKKQLPENHPNFGKTPNIRKNCCWYKNMYLRSGYELRFVKACEKHNIDFEQCKEDERIYLQDESGKFSYLSDFKINGQIIEVKGWIGPRTQRIINALKDINIKFIFKENLIKLEKSGEII